MNGLLSCVCRTKSINLMVGLPKMKKNLSWDDLSDFAAQLKGFTKDVSVLATGIVWYRFHCKGLKYEGIEGQELAKLMDSLHLCNFSAAFNIVNSLNVGSEYVERDSKKGGLIINYSMQDVLDERYITLLNMPPELPISNELISTIEFLTEDSFTHLLQGLIQQANTCYEYDMPDACALICRRLIELLLVKSFDVHGNLSVIQGSNGWLIGLGAIIRQAKSGAYFNLDSDTKSLMDDVWRLGNDAAHCDFHSIQKKDFDKFKYLMDKAFSELLARACLHRK